MLFLTIFVFSLCSESEKIENIAFLNVLCVLLSLQCVHSIGGFPVQ